MCFPFTLCLPQKCTKVTLTVFSIIIIFASGFCFYLAFTFKDSSLWNLQADKQADGVRIGNVLFRFIIATSSIGILAGITGIRASHKMTACSIASFAVLSITVFLIFSLIGVSFVLMRFYAQEFLVLYCDGQEITDPTGSIQAIKEITMEMEYSMKTLPEEWMCSYYCPCEDVADYQGVKTQQQHWNGTYTNFLQCYEELVNGGQVAELSPNLVELIQKVEAKNPSCAGLCSASNFPFSRDLNSLPSESCLVTMKEELGYNLMFVGVGLCSTALLAFLAFNVQLGLLKIGKIDYPQIEEEEQDLDSQQNVHVSPLQDNDKLENQNEVTEQKYSEENESQIQSEGPAAIADGAQEEVQEEVEEVHEKTE